MIHNKFALLEAGAERGNAMAALALDFISVTMDSAFEVLKRPSFARHMPKLCNSDGAERVAEALAVWIADSAPRAFAEMTGTRYAGSGLDCSAEGMERLRDQSEFILLAYADSETTPESILAQWLEDINAVMREDSFDYESAEAAVRQYHADIMESGYLPHKLEEARQLEEEAKREAERGDIDGDGFESVPFRLYVRDNAPESD